MKRIGMISMMARHFAREVLQGFRYGYPVCCIVQYLVCLVLCDRSLGYGWSCGFLRCWLDRQWLPLRMTCCSFPFRGVHTCEPCHPSIELIYGLQFEVIAR